LRGIQSRDISNGSFTVLDGVAHLAALEDPARVNRLLDDFPFDADSS
jgi:3-oxoadipate enol-lactonase